MSAADLASCVAALRDERGPRVAVGISGPDCAGKSTLAAELARTIGDEALVVPGDEFTRPRAERYADSDPGRGYYRDSFNYTPLYERLLPAFRGGAAGEVVLPVSDWEHDGWQERAFALGPTTVLIVEGCFLFVPPGDTAFDLTVWLDLPLDRVVERALARPRDVELMGGEDGVRRRYAERYLPGQRLHLERDDPASRAHVVLAAGL